VLSEIQLNSPTQAIPQATHTLPSVGNDHRTTESLRLAKTSQIIESNR